MDMMVIAKTVVSITGAMMAWKFGLVSRLFVIQHLGIIVSHLVVVQWDLANYIIGEIFASPLHIKQR